MSDFAKAARLDAGTIPVIDISGALDDSDMERVARDIHAAATQVGFFYIRGHGIAPELMEQAFAVARDFFAQPDAVKRQVAVGPDQRGWMSTGKSRLQGAENHDLKEVFFWGRVLDAEDPDLLAGKPLVARNRWPRAFPRLCAELLPYYNALCAVAAKVLSAVAVSLGVHADFFRAAYERPLARGQLVYYPPSSPTDEGERRFGVAPHTDFGMLTFLLQDDSGGLQVRLRDGTWVEAPPIPGTLVCNIGDLLQRWSNDRFMSTVHRVINRSTDARYSIPIFFDPKTDTIVDPRDLGATEPLHPPVTAGGHIAGRNARSFSQHKT